MRILVTGANIVHALPVIRRLGLLGHTLTVADALPTAAGFYSRHCARRWIYPSPAQGYAPFAEALQRFLTAHPHDRVVPLFEETLCVARAAEDLPSLVRASLGPYRRLMRVHDKSALYRTARELRIPIPETIEPDGEIPRDVTLPVVLKVAQSSCGRGVLKVDRPEDLVPAWQRLARDHDLGPGVRPIVQRALDADALCVLAFAHRGALSGLLTYKNLCAYPRRGGGGVLRESVHHEAVVRHTEALVRGLDWSGPLGLDFLLERSSGQCFLIDANPRITPGVALALRLGFDVAAMMLSDDAPPSVGEVAPGHRNVTEPMLFSWLMECLVAGPEGWREARAVASGLRGAHGDLHDPSDWHALRAAPAALWAWATHLGRSAPSGLEMVRSGQYTDYDATREDP